MRNCSEVLKGGVFETLIVNSDKNVSENIYEWLQKAEYEELKKATEAGLNIGLPIKGIPFKLGGDFSEDEYKNWKKAIAEQRTRSFNENETLQIIRKTASSAILNAWVNCQIGPNPETGTGIVTTLKLNPSKDVLLYKVRFLPNSDIDADTLPKVTEFIVTGAKTIQGIQVDDYISFGGNTATIERNGNSGITVNLQTSKGSSIEAVKALEEDIPSPLPLRENRFTAAIVAPNGKAYFFFEDRFIRFDFSSDKIDKIAKIQSEWPGLESWSHGIDAAVLHPNGKAYFFRGQEYKRFDFKQQKVDKTARISKDGWFGLSKSEVTSAILHPNGKAYFFLEGGRYQRYVFGNADKVDKTGKISVDGWKGLTSSQIIRAVIRHPNNGHGYFFFGNDGDFDTYQRFNFATDKVDKTGKFYEDNW